MTKCGLYVHVPFCVRKCGYCDFYSLATAGLAHRAEEDYLEALAIELADLPSGFHPSSVFIGGGTPTELTLPGLHRLLELVCSRIDPIRVEEWTVETNPGTLTREKAAAMRSAGVSRVSVGVQSFDDEQLRFLERIHSADQAADAVDVLRGEGFHDLNLDLIYALPGGTRRQLEGSLHRLLALDPSHVSCYALTFEPNTPFARRRDRGLVRETPAEDALAQYHLLRARLKEVGFVHYEISNFCRPGHSCRHNLLYWSGGCYIGCGPSAHSHWDGVRWANHAHLRRYCSAIRQGSSPRAFSETLSPDAKARETLVMSLRRIDGVSHSAFLRQTGFDYRELASPALSELVSAGLIQDDHQGLRLTETGLFVSDAIFAELV